MGEIWADADSIGDLSDMSGDVQGYSVDNFGSSQGEPQQESQVMSELYAIQRGLKACQY